MTTYHELSGFQRDLLEAIAAVTANGDIPYGLALKRWLDDRYDDGIHHSRLYQNLDELIDADLVARTNVDDRTNRYDLTATAEHLLAAHVDSLQTVCDPVVTDGGGH
jgi:DNA-binding PadR family transcriptional regulator